MIKLANLWLCKHACDKSKNVLEYEHSKVQHTFQKNPGKLLNFFLPTQKLKSGMHTLEWLFSEVEKHLNMGYKI